MHESSMAMGILGIVTDEAQKAGACAVKQVLLCVGDLAGVETTTLTSCFEMLSEGTVAHKAELVIKRIAASGTCSACGTAASGRGRMLKCPLCKTGSVKLSTGRELYVESIEVEKLRKGDEHAGPHP